MTASEETQRILRDVGTPLEQHRGQLRMAERVVSTYREQLRHVHGVGWFLWDGNRWKRDQSGAVTRAVISTVKAAYADLSNLGRDDQKDLLTDIHRCESASGVEGVLRLAGDLLPLAVSVDQLDADPYLFNTLTGTLDLRTGKVCKPDPTDLITKVAGCGYDPDAHSEAFDTFLSQILPDPDVRSFVQRVFGHALVGQVIEHVLPIFTGTGLNGKSTLVDLVGDAFGDYAIAAEPDLLVDRGAVHTTGQADLLGVRLATCSETDDKRRLAAATVKRLTGGDKIRARRMRQDFIEFDASHSVLLVTNFKPKVSADDPALWRRLRVVPFDVVVGNPNLHLKEQLGLELPAVLSWIVDGHAAWAQDGLAEPAAVRQATDEYRATGDAVGRFLDEKTITTNTFGHVKSRDLFHSWGAWCIENGEQAGSEMDFAAAMGSRGFSKYKTNGVMTWRGLILAATDEQQAAS